MSQETSPAAMIEQHIVDGDLVKMTNRENSEVEIGELEDRDGTEVRKVVTTESQLKPSTREQKNEQVTRLTMKASGNSESKAQVKKGSTERARKNTTTLNKE